MGALGEALGVPRVALGAPGGGLGAPGGAGLVSFTYSKLECETITIGFATLGSILRPPTGTQMMIKPDDFCCFPGDTFFLFQKAMFFDAKCIISYVVFMISSLSQ